MTELLTAAQMRTIEQAAIASGEVTGLELMERAGRGVVDAVFAEWPDLATAPHRAVVLCGPGNNGGDGFVVARLLKEWGWEVEVYLYGDAAKLPPDARVNYERWGELGEVFDFSIELFSQGDFLAMQDLIFDALFGTGLSRPIGLPLVALTATAEVGQSHRLVAIDLPSGTCSDSARVLESSDGEMVAGPADLTVTFHRQKLGHVLGDGPALCGKVVVADIGLNARSSGASAPVRPRPAPQGGGEIAPTLGLRANLATLAQPDLRSLAKPNAHKYTHGHALILSGPPGKGGAARLAARGALRIGAGLVTLACPEPALPEHAAQLTAIMTRPLAEIGDLIETLADDRITAVCLGPGLGLGDDARAMVSAVLAAERPTVLDADALTDYEDDPATLFDQLHDACVLTPHAGEFRRLFPDFAAKLQEPATRGPAYSKVDATRAAAARAGCTVLFKGPDTVIADPSGRCTVNASVFDRAAPWLATAGSGDVLAGFIAGLLARGLDLMAATESAAWLHTECARSFGPGLIAEDLPEELPKVFRAVGL